MDRGSSKSTCVCFLRCRKEGKTAPSEIIKVSNGKEVESIFEDDGNLISASSVAVRYKDLLFVGTVMDDYILVLKQKGE